MNMKKPAIRSKALTDAARGQECTLQISGVCNFNPETVVFAHFPSVTHGMAYKSDDFWGADVCSSCHDVIDGRVTFDFEQGEREEYMLRAVHATLSRRVRAGLIQIKRVKP
ncbi:DUF1364 domain-containing protein [Grimontia hollisae]|uniref:DUF1364 domain-containing protein n=1 Tax=Grimontia hollisae TaxID=673 RepID=UPI001E3CE42E|nr:DUF1364 domain-containing protein [Grimontia hollisae]MDF2185884.1 DUF1364 domain-containing protein [Grimontia hollisae]